MDAVDLRRLACPFTGGSHRVRHLYARVHDASFVGLRTGPPEPSGELLGHRNHASPDFAMEGICKWASAGQPTCAGTLRFVFCDL